MNRIGLLPTLHNILEEYEEMCKPFCKKMNIPQTAFDILMFLANNPEYPTAEKSLNTEESVQTLFHYTWTNW